MMKDEILEVSKVKFTPDETVIINYTASEKPENGQPVKVNGTKTIKQQPHQDFVNAFKRLRIHYALLCEFVDLDAVSKEMFDLETEVSAYEMKELEGVEVRSIILNNHDDPMDEGVTLSGFKTLRQGKVLNALAPFTKFRSEADYYPFKVDLYNDVMKAIDEVMFYADGKFFDDGQLEMNIE